MTKLIITVNKKLNWYFFFQKKIQKAEAKSKNKRKIAPNKKGERKRVSKGFKKWRERERKW